MNAKRDENNKTTLICASESDGISIIRVKVDPLTHRLKAVDLTTGTDFGRNVAIRDENNVPVLLGVSSGDGKTPKEVYADISGNLLINSH